MIPEASKVFGGTLLKGNAKGPRPLSSKAPLHLVLKANRGFGTRSMLHPEHVKKVNACVRRQAEATGIRLYHFVNVGNHLHLVVKIHDRKRFAAFIRAISGLIARQVLGVERGSGATKTDQFNRLKREVPKNEESKQSLRLGYWIQRPFTRVANWGRDYSGLSQYMLKNQRQVSRWGIDISDRLGSMVPGFDSNISIEPFRNSA